LLLTSTTKYYTYKEYIKLDRSHFLGMPDFRIFYHQAALNTFTHKTAKILVDGRKRRFSNHRNGADYD
jgi:hypothetical protein